MCFVKESLIHATPERVFAFHEQPDALRLLTPPWEYARVVQPALISAVGSRAIIEAPILGPFKTRWVAEHTIYDPPRLFEDVQVSGPFRKWRHRHIVEPHAEGAILTSSVNINPIQGALDGFLPADVSGLPLVCAPTRFPLLVRLPVESHFFNIAPKTDS